jgi:hypothetical protein
MHENMTYAERWAEAINETYDPESGYDLLEMELIDSSEPNENGAIEIDLYEAEKLILTKAARCLRDGVPATFTAGELDLVRHRMPAHEVEQSGAVRWVLDRYGEVE